MVFNNVFSNWKDSLEIFKKKNVFLFLLASLNTFRRSLVLLVKYFWWLFAMLLCVDVYVSFYGSPVLWQYSMFVAQVVFSFIHAYALLAARPSIERKDIRYFSTYMQKFTGVIGVLLGYYLFFLLHVSFFIFFIWIFAFHYFDSKSGFKNCLVSFVASFKIIFYYLPVFIVFGVFKFLLDHMIYVYRDLKLWGINYLFGSNKIMFLIVDHCVMVLFGLISLLFISFVSIYYTRSKHKNFDFFFRGA
jgi:hypothetical protein